MPRVAATPRTLDPASTRGRRGRGRKPPARQDRLSQRDLFIRRVKKSLKPGLWVFGILAVLIVVGELLRGLSSVPAPQSTSAPAAAAPRWGLASLAADLGLRLHKVEILGAQTTNPDLLRQAIGVKPGMPIFGISLAAVQARVAQLGPVKSAIVERVLPGTLIVRVVERDAYAIWQTVSNGKTVFVVLDRQGDIIAGQDAAQAKRREPNLLLLSGAGAPANAAQLLSALKTVPAVRARVVAAQWVDGLRWNLVLKDQAVVKLPSADMEAALNQLAQLQNSMQLLNRPVEVIDLRQPGRLVVRPYPAAQKKPEERR